MSDATRERLAELCGLAEDREEAIGLIAIGLVGNDVRAGRRAAEMPPIQPVEPFRAWLREHGYWQLAEATADLYALDI